MEQDSINQTSLIKDEPLVDLPYHTNDDENLVKKPHETVDEKNIDDQPPPESRKAVIDNGIFEFMSPERAIELYKQIHSTGVPQLDWKFYGRRKPEERPTEQVEEIKQDQDETTNNDVTLNQTANTEFDFDDEFSNLQTEALLVNESLQLKRKSEPGGEKRTNLSDIMSDILKESHLEDE